MNQRTLSRLNPEHMGGEPHTDLADRIRRSPTGLPELNGKDRTYDVEDVENWQNLLTKYTSIEQRVGGYTVWSCVDGYDLEGYCGEGSLEPAQIVLVHLPRDLAFGD